LQGVVWQYADLEDHSRQWRGRTHEKTFSGFEVSSWTGAKGFSSINWRKTAHVAMADINVRDRVHGPITEQTRKSWLFLLSEVNILSILSQIPMKVRITMVDDTMRYHLVLSACSMECMNSNIMNSQAVGKEAYGLKEYTERVVYRKWGQFGARTWIQARSSSAARCNSFHTCTV
jgi:hypothetical protein